MNLFISKVLQNTLGVFLALFVASTVSGTMLWLTYDSLFLIFPTLKESGLLAVSPEWWTLVLFSWFFKTLFILPNFENSSFMKSKNVKKEVKKEILND